MFLRYLTIEGFKCVDEISPLYLNAMFMRKECPYALRDSSILMRRNGNLFQYGLKSFKSYGAKNLEPFAYIIQGRYIFKSIKNIDQIMGWPEM